MKTNITAASNHYKHFLTIDWEDAHVETETLHESINGCPVREYHGHVSSYRLPQAFFKSDLECLLEHLNPIIEKISAGYQSIWDGSNYIAKFSDEAESERFSLQYEIDNFIGENWIPVSAVPADEYFCNLDDFFAKDSGKVEGVSPGMSTEQIEALAQKLQDEAAYQDHYILGLVDYLTEQSAALPA